MSWEVKYRTEFTDILGLEWRTDIEEMDYAGDITVMQSTGTPLIIEHLSNSDNLFDSPVCGSTAVISVYSDTNFQYLDLYAIETEFKYRVSIYHGVTLYYRGYLDGNYQEPYDGVSYPVAITSADGLGSLKEIEYKDGEDYYNGHKLVSQIIIDILGKIGVTGDYTGFTELVNIYEDRMDDAAADSMFDQTLIDVDTFMDMSCYEVLEELLNPFSAVIRNIGGVFYIYRPKELINETVWGRTFTAAETKSETSISTWQLISRSSVPTDLRDVEGGMLMIQSPAKKVTITQDYGNKESWIDNYQFKTDTFTFISDLYGYSTDYWTRVGAVALTPISNGIPGETNGVIIMSQDVYPEHTKYIYQTFATNAKVSDDKFGFSFEYMFYNSGSNLVPDVPFYIEIKNSAGTRWLQNYFAKGGEIDDIRWDNGQHYIITMADSPPGITDWMKFERKFEGLEADGPYQISIFSLHYYDPWIFVGIRNILFYTYSTESSMKSVLRIKPVMRRNVWNKFLNLFGAARWRDESYYYFPSEPKTVVEREYIATNDINGKKLGYKVIIGDVADVNLDNVMEQFAGAMVLSDNSHTLTWHKQGGIGGDPLLQVIADEIAEQYSRPKQFIQLPIMEDNQVNNLPHVNVLGCFQDSLNLYNGKNRIFVFNRGLFNVRDREWGIDLIEVGTSPYDPEAISIVYGYLYNWYAATDERNIANNEWHVPAGLTDGTTLRLYLDPAGDWDNNEAGIPSKETGTTYWIEDYGTNTAGFNGRGAGHRLADGTFDLLKINMMFWHPSEFDGATNKCIGTLDSYWPDLVVPTFGYGSSVANKNNGVSIRLLKDSTELEDGEIGTYTGNDGKIYRTICIGTQEWLADNLCETKYRDGSSIPEVTNGTAWAALTTGARCSYDNDEDNAFIPFIETVISADSTLITSDSTIYTVDNG